MENQDTSNKVVSDHVMAALYGGMMSFVDSKLEYCGYSQGYRGLQNSGCAKTVSYILLKEVLSFSLLLQCLGQWKRVTLLKMIKLFVN